MDVQATVGKSPFDKIALHRVAKGPNPTAHPEAVVLYLPGTNMNGEVALDDPRYSFQVYLAEQGVDVWSMDYRTHFIPPQTPQTDLSELAGWTNDLFESDIDAAAKFVSEKSGRSRIFVAGFSRGVEFAYLFAAKHYPERVAGIIALDGFIPTHPMSAKPLEPGEYAEDIGGKHLTYDKRYTLMQMVIENPDQAAPIPKYKTARENLEHVMYDAAPGNGAFANMQAGHSDAVVLAKLLIAYDRYWPSVQDGENPFTPELLASLKASKIPGNRIRQYQLRRAIGPARSKRPQNRPAHPTRHSPSSTAGAISTCWREPSPRARSSRRRRRGSSSIRSRRIRRSVRPRRSGAARRRNNHDRGERPCAEQESRNRPSKRRASAARRDDRSQRSQREIYNDRRRDHIRGRLVIPHQGEARRDT